MLAALLISLVALPHGICFCELVQCASANKAILSDDDSTPDDHDKDCPCKLREAMAVVQTDVVPFQTSHLFACTASPPLHGPTSSVNIDPGLFDNAKSLDEPIPLILCALRI
jgi:hypothetical protein